MKYDVAGDPMTGLRWVRRTPEKIAEELKKLGIAVSRTTVARLLKQMRFSLRVNHKRLNSCSNKDRNKQFEYIASLRKKFARRGDPVVSVDSKKRELIGRFKNAGTTWSRESTPVKDHDFRSEAEGIGLPYGLYDTGENCGTVVVGTSHDTSEFAVASIAKWLRRQGRRSYPETKRLLLLADNGGSNAPRTRAWKYYLQRRVCDEFNISVTVVHYPPGTSKWNPIEHRLFSEISKNWAGEPLTSYEVALKYISTTTTTTGLTVKAYLDERDYPKVTITDEQMDAIELQRHTTQPSRNYTISPQ